VLGYILMFEVGVFLFFSLPIPGVVKKKIVRVLLGSKFMRFVMWVHLGLCIIAGLFYFELTQS
jgi:hypothetical protein